jgi:predicted DCC family thiol-disulfide oxidoreductase YuxK
MKELFVVYDSRCGLCTFLKRWIQRQGTYVRIRMIASGSPESQQRFPHLPPGELAVVSDTGQVWIGDRAWIIVLWALKRFRGLSRTLSKPALLPLARQAFAGLSASRSKLSSLLRLESEDMARIRLMGIRVPPCRIQPL